MDKYIDSQRSRYALSLRAAIKQYQDINYWKGAYSSSLSGLRAYNAKMTALKRKEASTQDRKDLLRIIKLYRFRLKYAKAKMLDYEK